MCCMVSVLQTKDSHKSVRTFVGRPEINMLQSITTSELIDIDMVMLVKVAAPVAVIEAQWLVCRYNIWYPWYHNGNKNQNEAFNW